jgi:hypothetical protein
MLNRAKLQKLYLEMLIVPFVLLHQQYCCPITHNACPAIWVEI